MKFLKIVDGLPTPFQLALVLFGMAPAFGVAAVSPPRVATLALQAEPPQLNTTKATDQQSFFVLGHIMEGLTRTGKSGDIVPGVAEKWEIGEKGATFHLRADAKWADGKPVTARDFVFAWRTVLDPKNASEYAFILYPVKNAEAINQGKQPGTALGVSAPDDRTLKITFEKPCGYFLGLTAFSVYFPVREDFYKLHAGRYGADAEDLLSNGPFILTKWVHGASLSMDKNPNYWNASKIQLDKIEVPYITPDYSAQFNFYKDHKIDLLERMGKDELPRAQAEKFKMKSYSDGSVWFMEFNFREGRITRNKNLRKAIQLSFDMDEYVSKVVGIPGTKPGRSLIPGWVKGSKELFRKEYPITAPRMNLVEARKFLDAAKKELGGAIPPLVWLTGDTNFSNREAEYFQNIFRSHLGLEVRIDKQTFKQRLAKMTSGDFDIVSAGWGPDFADPMTFADLKASWNENNRGKYSSAEYDRLIREAQATADPKKRMDAMAAAEKIALEDVAIVPTYERIVIYMIQDRLQGVVRNAIGADPDLTYATVK